MRKLRGVSPVGLDPELTDGAPAPADCLRYLVYLPAGYDADADARWPLVLFLHGAGERGTDFDTAANVGLPRMAEDGVEFPFVLVAPQCADESQWVAEATTLNRMLDEVCSGLRIDPSRIAATGLSMGGYGTWSLAIRYPDRFAAIAPICGGLWTNSLEPLRDLPIWTFHGEGDTVVPVESTADIVDALLAIGGNVRFTRYPDVGHDAWTRAYADPQLLAWLVSHRKPGRAVAAPPTSHARTGGGEPRGRRR